VVLPLHYHHHHQCDSSSFLLVILLVLCSLSSTNSLCFEIICAVWTIISILNRLIIIIDKKTTTYRSQQYNVNQQISYKTHLPMSFSVAFRCTCSTIIKHQYWLFRLFDVLIISWKWIWPEQFLILSICCMPISIYTSTSINER
jgi:hypothetical protein